MSKEIYFTREVSCQVAIGGLETKKCPLSVPNGAKLVQTLPRGMGLVLVFKAAPGVEPEYQQLTATLVPLGGPGEAPESGEYAGCFVAPDGDAVFVFLSPEAPVAAKAEEKPA